MHQGFQTHTVCFEFGQHIKRVFSKAERSARQAALALQRKRAPLKHHFVLATHHVGIDQRQADRQHTRSHGFFTLGGFALVKRRGVQHHQKLCPVVAGVQRGLLEPSVFANEQTNAHTLHREHAGVVAGFEITAFIKHLVVGQLALGITGHQMAFTKHRGHVEAVLHRHRAGAFVVATGVPHHHMHAVQVGEFVAHQVECVFAGLNERRPQVQIFGGIATNGEFGRDQQTHTAVIGGAGGVDDFVGIALHVTDGEIELGYTELKRHE